MGAGGGPCAKNPSERIQDDHEDLEFAGVRTAVGSAAAGMGMGSHAMVAAHSIAVAGGRATGQGCAEAAVDKAGRDRRCPAPLEAWGMAMGSCSSLAPTW